MRRHCSILEHEQGFDDRDDARRGFAVAKHWLTGANGQILICPEDSLDGISISHVAHLNASSMHFNIVDIGRRAAGVPQHGAEYCDRRRGLRLGNGHRLR